MGNAALSAFEVALGVVLPEELRALLARSGEGAPHLLGLTAAFERSARAAEPFPHGTVDAQGAMRPGEHVFLDTFDPPGTWLLAETDAVQVHLVVTGEQRGTVWLGTPYGLAPAYFVRDDVPVQHGFDSWYAAQLELDPIADAVAAEPAPEVETEALGCPDMPEGNTRELELLLSGAPDGARVEIPRGRYELERSLVIDRPLTIEASPGDVEIVAPRGYPALVVRGGHVRVSGITFRGTIPDQPEPGEIGVVVGLDATAHLVSLRLLSLFVGALVCDFAHASLERCEAVHSRTALTADRQGKLEASGCGLRGGETGLTVREGASATLVGCELEWQSHGVDFDSDGSLRMEDCRIQHDVIGITVLRGDATLAQNFIAVDGDAGVWVRGGRSRIIGNALPFAGMFCIAVTGDARATVAHNVIGAANYGLFVELGAGGALRAVGNVSSGGALDGIFVRSGQVELVANQSTGSRQWGIHVERGGVELRANEAYRNGREGICADGLDESENHIFDNDWENGRRLRGSNIVKGDYVRFTSAPFDEPGSPERACAVTGAPCVGPTRVFIVDLEAKAVPLSLPVLVTFSAGRVARSELRPEGQAMLAWLGRRHMQLTLDDLLSGEVEREGRRLGAVLVDDLVYLAAAATCAARDQESPPADERTLDRLMFDAFGEEPAGREILSACLADDDPVLRARLATLAYFQRCGGIGSARAARGPMIELALEKRGCEPVPASAPDVVTQAGPMIELDLPAPARAPEVGVPLPPGGPYAARHGARGPPPVWVAETPMARAGECLAPIAAGLASHGHWPIVIDDLDWLGPPEDIRPDPAEPTNASRAGHAQRALAFLEERWSEIGPSPEGDDEEGRDEDPRLPFGPRFPGLAAAATGELPPQVLDGGVAELSGHLVLVSCRRPGDLLRLLGWWAPANHYQGDADVHCFAATLASWEERFGAVVVGLESDTMTLAVRRPPTDPAQALLLAAEHYAICPDIVDQGAGSITAYAKALLQAPLWRLWWD